MHSALLHHQHTGMQQTHCHQANHYPKSRWHTHAVDTQCQVGYPQTTTTSMHWTYCAHIVQQALVIYWTVLQCWMPSQVHHIHSLHPLSRLACSTGHMHTTHTIVGTGPVPTPLNTNATMQLNHWQQHCSQFGCICPFHAIQPSTVHTPGSAMLTPCPRICWAHPCLA